MSVTISGYGDGPFDHLSMQLAEEERAIFTAIDNNAVVLKLKSKHKKRQKKGLSYQD